MKRLFAAAVAAISLAGAAQAATVTNGSFEDPGFTGGFTTYGAGSTALTGWTISGGNLDYIGSLWQASDGNQSIDLNGNTGAGTTISQTIVGLVTGKTYTLLFDMAGNPDGPPAEKSVDVSIGGASDTFTFDITGNSRSSMGWETMALGFVANDTSALLSFGSTTPQCCYGPALDNVRIEAAVVPVPAAGALLLTGLGGFVALRRRKSRR